MSKSASRLHLTANHRRQPLISQLTASELQVSTEALAPDESTKIIDLEGRRARVTRMSHGEFSVIALSSDQDRLKSVSLVRKELELALAAASSILEATERVESRGHRLIHNLRSVTAKTMQEVFALVQQRELIGKSPAEQVSYIQKEIAADSAAAAQAFVEILKHQGAQKAEYSAFETLSGGGGALKPERHSVHKVLMNVFYLFFGDFLKNRVRARVEPTQEAALFDYDSMHACIYFLVENASKYAKPSSKLLVSTQRSVREIVITFEMESLFISAAEEEYIFHEGFSGELATGQKKNGSGIGLYLARELTLLNSGTLTVLCRRRPNDAMYSSNAFTLALPLGNL
ncbi:ATP-binding protein [Xanthomonas arboricola]|uniref:ATP-binding protein n=1 Tax=Xanthomonas arboricola TaxID=56448 RepID=UPI000F8C9AC4|nr:ATP-binding protein [Xanthomonas arboricola]